MHIIRALATLGFVCASFTATASVVLVVYTRLNPDVDAIQSPGGILLRVVLFGAIAVVAAGILWCLRPAGKMRLKLIPKLGTVDLPTSPDAMEGVREPVIPANAGIQERERTNRRGLLDSRFRGNDVVEGAQADPGKPLDSRLRGNDAEGKVQGDPGKSLDSRFRGNDVEGRARETFATARGAWIALAAILVASLPLLFVNLGAYPWAAPDEVHHLVVARNIAVHGSYASGHPAGGLRYFDSFDSVGPAVLGPVAVAFSVFGVGLVPARVVMVLFFIGLCLVTYRIARAGFGAWAGVVAVGLLVGAYSSIYLGRTVYGEVAAHFYLLCGLLAWRRGLGGRDGSYGSYGSYGVESPPVPASRVVGCFRGGVVGWGLIAGVLVGLAVLSKAFLVLVAFSFLGVWLYDRMTCRSIRWVHVFFPCVGGLLPLVGWALFQRFHAPPGLADAGGTLAIYQHYLLFGVSGFLGAFGNGVLAHPLAHLGWLIVVLLTVPVLFRDRHDPALLVLFLYALFVVYWWLFFTPGTLHRYLWNSYAILAIFSAYWVCAAAGMAWGRQYARWTRVVALAALLLLTAPGARWIASQAGEIFTRDEMAPELSLVEAITSLPPGERIATDIGRVPGLADFFGGRLVVGGPDPVALLARFDTVVTRDSAALRAKLPLGCRVKSAGEFVLLSSAQPPE